MNIFCIFFNRKILTPLFGKIKALRPKFFCSLLSQKHIKSCERSPLSSRIKNTTEWGPLGFKPRPTAARLSSGSLADFLARKDLADFLVEAFARFSRRFSRIL